MNEKHQGWRRTVIDSLFRVLASLIFVVAGFGHVSHPQTIVERLVASRIGALLAGIAPAELLVVATGVVLLTAGLALLLGVKTQLAALALMACLVPITLSVQLAPGQMGPLFKNVALFGMLLHFANSGAGEYALTLEAWWKRERRVLP